MTSASGGNGQEPTAPSAHGQEPTQGTPTASNGQEPTGNTSPSQQQQSAPNPSYAPPSADEWRKVQSELAEARRDAAAYRKARQEAEEAKLSDLEKAAKRAEAAEASVQALRQRIGATELKIAAQAAGIIDTDIAAALLSSKVEYGADGEPTNIAELVAGLKKDKPNLFPAMNGRNGPAQPQNPSSGGAANPGRAAGNGGLTLEMIQQMPMRERIARMDEIKAWEKAQAGASSNR
jgi:hypothetical protein